MKDNIKSQFVGTAERLKNNRTKVAQSKQNEQIEKQNTRTLMQALQGCRKNCRECKEDEEDYPQAQIIQKGGFKYYE